jgi:formylglycine-generating enzyme
MRAPLIRLSCLLSLLIASSASAVVIDWVTVGNPGNPADTQVMTFDGTTGYGAVPYVYRISKYEVTNAQYAEFLNAIARTDPNGVYSALMSPDPGYGNITRSGSSGSYSYSVIAGDENLAMNEATFWDALRFAN